MTEEEKKEFEEFLQWKAEKAKREAELAQRPDEQTTSKEHSALPAATSKGTNFNLPAIVFLVIAGIIIVLCLHGCPKHTETEVEAVIEHRALTPEEEQEIEEMAQHKVDSVKTAIERRSLLSEGKEGEWNFSTEMDEMTDDKNIWASIVSENSSAGSSAYSNTYCTLTVRYMKKWGGFDVLVGLTNGQIYGNEYRNENYIMARFDNEQPIKYWYNESADASSKTVFIRKSADFINRCKKATSIKLEVPVFQGGRPVFIFKVNSPLVWPQ